MLVLACLFTVLASNMFPMKLDVIDAIPPPPEMKDSHIP